MIIQINILDLLDIYGDSFCYEILNSFVCPLNFDVEDFIHKKAIEFAKQRIAITFLVFKETPNGNIFVGYYTLSNKFVAVSAVLLSKNLQKRISKFSQYDAHLNRYLISMPLIAQIGKNYSETSKSVSFEGKTLLELACQRIRNVQYIIGGKTTYIECASNPKLYDFYNKNGFVQFGQREKEQEEFAENSILIQMLKYL